MPPKPNIVVIIPTQNATPSFGHPELFENSVKTYDEVCFDFVITGKRTIVMK